MTTKAEVDELISKMAEERDRLLEIASAFSEEDASRSPADGEGEAQWSVKEQLAHLALMENAYRGWVQRALSEENPDVTNDRPEMPAIGLREANSRPLPELVAQLRQLRDQTLTLIESMRPQDFERKATQQMFGTLTVMQWLRSYYRHDRMHQAQMSGREPDYRPRYTGDKEPDQRVR